MKKIFSVIGIACVIVFLHTIPVYAAIPLDPSVIEVKSTTAAANTEQPPRIDAATNEYVLPYPGILPDHPLYMLKKFRDSILEMLITDPIRKVDFYILQSDKEISAAEFLSNKGNKGSIADSVIRATTFKEKALSQAKKIKSQGKQVPGFLIEKLTSSIQKQLMLNAELEAKADASAKSVFATSNQTIVSLKAAVDELK